MTVEQWCFTWMLMKHAGNIRDNITDQQLRYLSEVAMPPNNFVPPSLYIMKKVC